MILKAVPVASVTGETGRRSKRLWFYSKSIFVNNLIIAGIQVALPIICNCLLCMYPNELQPLLLMYSKWHYIF